MNPLILLLSGALLALVLWAWGLRGVAGSNAIAVCVVLASCAVAFNVIVPIPNVEATTTVVVCCAVVLGARVGATVGMLAVLGTGVTGGLGPWTAWQVAATALVALLAAAARPAAARLQRDGRAERVLLAALTVAGVLTYDLVVTAATLQSTGVATAMGGSTSFGTMLLLGAPYTVVHVVGSTAFTVLAGPALVFSLGRARARIEQPPTSPHPQHVSG